MSAAKPLSYTNFFEADLSADDLAFLEPFQDQMHATNTPHAMPFAYIIGAFCLLLSWPVAGPATIAAMLVSAAMLTVARPVTLWRALGIERPSRQIQAQATFAALCVSTWALLPLMLGADNVLGTVAMLAVMLVVFGPISYAFVPAAAKSFGIVSTLIFTISFAAMGTVQTYEYAALTALGGITTQTVCRFIFSNFATRFVRERDLSDAADTVKLLLHDYGSQLADFLWEIDAKGKFTNYSDRGLDATKRSIEELSALNPMDLLHRESDRERLIEVLRTKQPFRDLEVAIMVGEEERWFRLSGKPQFTDEGKFIRTRGVCADVTDAKKAAAQIAYMARYDALTDLPNRRMFAETLAGALQRRKDAELLAVLYLDLDQFKAINDTLGHAIGDRVLQIAAQRIGACLSVKDIVSRQGGDEFAVLLTAPASREDADAVAAAIIAAMAEPLVVDDHQIAIGTSVGIAFAPGDATQAEDLIKRADLALYHSKQAGRARASHFAPNMQKVMQARRQIEADLRKAIAQNEFELHYQPLINLQTGKAVGYEALIRWNHPKRGVIMPDVFIPVAEETGLIVPIGEWVIRNALAEATNWPEHLSVSVNLSPVQLASSGLVPVIISALAANAIPPRRLEVEITESVLMKDSEANMRVLHQLRSLGVQIALDDFGTGYSSLNYLRGFPFDKIKIDRCFISEVDSREDSRAIVRAVTSLANSLGMITTAEGVEREQELDLLRAEGCTQVQGYYFSQPVPAAQVPQRLAAASPNARPTSSRRSRRAT